MWDYLWSQFYTQQSESCCQNLTSETDGEEPSAGSGTATAWSRRAGCSCARRPRCWPPGSGSPGCPASRGRRGWRTRVQPKIKILRRISGNISRAVVLQGGSAPQKPSFCWHQSRKLQGTCRIVQTASKAANKRSTKDSFGSVRATLYCSRVTDVLSSGDGYLAHPVGGQILHADLSEIIQLWKIVSRTPSVPRAEFPEACDMRQSIAIGSRSKEKVNFTLWSSMHSRLGFLYWWEFS